MKKNYVLDTNILLQDKDAIFGFEDNNVWITGITLQELDGKKNASGELGFAAREVGRTLDNLSLSGDLLTGCDLRTGGKLFLEPNGVDAKRLPSGFDSNSPDNRIISTCLHLKEKLKEPVILVTNDRLMRVIAKSVSLKAEAYRNDHLKEQNIYTGRRTVYMSARDIKALKDNGEVPCNKSVSLAPFETAGDEEKELYENEFLLIHPQTEGESDLLGIWQQGSIKRILPGKEVYYVKGRNAAQEFALYALTAPVEEIPLVFLIGPAGSAKTFLSIAAGLDGVMDGKYQKLLITRNNVTSDEAFGYLPGELDEKAAPLLNCFYDNIFNILSGDKDNRESLDQVKYQVEDLFETGTVEFAPMAYMRGRSIKDSFIILDEAQNASQTQIRDLITRAGTGTKVIIAGDLEQIDAPALDKWNCGLNYAATRMKSSALTATLYFTKEECQRSALAAEAVGMLLDRRNR